MNSFRFPMSGMIIFLIFIFLGLLSASPARCSTPAPPGNDPCAYDGDWPLLTLEEAVEIALSGNRQIQAAALGVKKEQEGVKEADSAFYPQVGVAAKQTNLLTHQDFTMSKGAVGTFPGIGPIPATDTVVARLEGSNTIYSFDVVQPLTGLYKVNMASGAQKALLSIAREDERKQRQDTIRNVKQGYFDILDTRSAMDAARENVGFLTELRRVVKEQVNKGIVLKGELLQVESQLAEALCSQAALVEQQATQMEKLNVLLGRPIDTPFRVALPWSGQGEIQGPADVKELKDAALRQRPELLKSRHNVRLNEYQKGIKRYDYYPDVSLFASYIYQTNSGLLPPKIGVVGLRAQWAVFDWGRRAARVGGQDRGVAQARKIEEEVREEVLVEVGAAYRRLKVQGSLIEVRKSALSAAEENLRVAKNRFRQKMALTRDVLQAGAQVCEARHKFQKAVLDYASALADLDRAVGRDR